MVLGPKVKIGYGLGSVAYAVCLYAAWQLGRANSTVETNLLLCVFGGVAGWIVGLLLTPKNDPEAKDFQKIGGAILTFVTGYLLAKTDPLFDAAVESGTLESLLGRALLLGSTFLIGALFVFVGRKYWHDDA